MSNWKTKSEESTQSAKLLIENNFTSASVHCSYYSVIQLINHILSKNQIPKLRSTNSHIALQNTIVKKLKEDKSAEKEISRRNFHNFFDALKKLRVKADYKNIIITEPIADAALKQSKQINEILKENFEI